MVANCNKISNLWKTMNKKISTSDGDGQRRIRVLADEISQICAHAQLDLMNLIFELEFYDYWVKHVAISKQAKFRIDYRNLSQTIFKKEIRPCRWPWRRLRRFFVQCSPRWRRPKIKRRTQISCSVNVWFCVEFVLDYSWVWVVSWKLFLFYRNDVFVYTLCVSKIRIDIMLDVNCD